LKHRLKNKSRAQRSEVERSSTPFKYMKSEILQKARGVRDYGPSEAIMRNKIIDILRSTFELFGYNPIETPIIERYELFASKYGIGEESDAMRETFKLKDQGDRKIVLRTEFTVPFARFVGMNQDIKLPFKRYQLGSVFRDGPIKLGRYREFWQCDVDSVGISSAKVDGELLQLANNVFKKLGIDVVIKINNRKILNAFMDYVGIEYNKQKSVIITLDKLDKLGEKVIKEELLAKDISRDKINKLIDLINISGDNSELIDKLQNIIGECDGLSEIKEAIDCVYDNENILFSPSLARGLAYYTGNVFEVFLTDNTLLSSSIAGGGRYDDMIGGLIGNNQNYPAVGLSFGLDTIFDAMKLSNKDILLKKNITDVYIIPLGTNFYSEIIKLTNTLRTNDINVDVDYLGRKLKKAMEYVNDYQIPFVLIIGEDEIKNKQFTIKNMFTGDQEMCPLEKVINIIKEYKKRV